ncbi:hypothetical protein BN132_3023 [Cronobacter turicensis 564]|nr:hypothetical protein BN132_3023 [Cronobacter turicensis 564]
MTVFYGEPEGSSSVFFSSFRLTLIAALSHQPTGEWRARLH